MPPLSKGAVLPLPAEFSSSRKLSKSPASGTKFSTSTRLPAALPGLVSLLLTTLGCRVEAAGLAASAGLAELTRLGLEVVERLEKEMAAIDSVGGSTRLEVWPTTMSRRKMDETFEMGC